ncbi:12597_t:CDS:1, partial [Cetraspora pellucida]
EIKRRFNREIVFLENTTNENIKNFRKKTKSSITAAHKVYLQERRKLENSEKLFIDNLTKDSLLKKQKLLDEKEKELNLIEEKYNTKIE